MPSLARGNFGILAHPLPYLSTYLPILTFPVDREEVFINLYAEFFLLIAAGILAPTCLKLGLIDILAMRKLMVRLDAASKAIRRLN